MTTTRCRAKNPPTCPKHGKRSLGVGAEAKIQKYLDPNKRHPIAAKQRATLPLKEMHADALAKTISEFANQTTGINQTKVDEAMLFAAQVHRKDFRANRGEYPYTPYIEHPLRNTLRVIRYGCDDEATINAGILHDTVEDHPFEIAKRYAGVHTRDEHEARAACFTYIEQTWGQETARIVRGMSNPIGTDDAATPEAKRAIYAQHVREAIEEPKVALDKIADLVDNAVSLHHTLTGMTPESVQRKAKKYLGVWDDIEHRIRRERIERKFPVSDTGVDKIEEHLRLGRERLERFARPVEQW